MGVGLRVVYCSIVRACLGLLVVYRFFIGVFKVWEAVGGCVIFGLGQLRC